MLSDWTAPQIVVACEKCGRHEAFDTKTVRAATLDDITLIDLRRSLLRLSSTMAVDEAGENDEQRLAAEQADIGRRGRPTVFREPVATGGITRFD